VNGIKKGLFLLEMKHNRGCLESFFRKINLLIKSIYYLKLCFAENRNFITGFSQFYAAFALYFCKLTIVQLRFLLIMNYFGTPQKLVYLPEEK
jgi:hypothetical protein